MYVKQKKTSEKYTFPMCVLFIFYSTLVLVLHTCRLCHCTMRITGEQCCIEIYNHDYIKTNIENGETVYVVCKYKTYNNIKKNCI